MLEADEFSDAEIGRRLAAATIMGSGAVDEQVAMLHLTKNERGDERRRRLIAQCCSQLSGEALNRLYEQVVEFAIKEVGDGLKFDNRVLRGGRFHVDLDKYGV